MTVTVHNVTPTFKTRLRTPCLVIIEYTLSKLSGPGSAGQMLYLSLLPNYLAHNQNSIHHEVIKFDLKNTKAISKHAASVKKGVQNLQEKHVFLHFFSVCELTVPTSRYPFDHAILIIHTHSDDTSGDLCYTSKGGEGNQLLSDSLDQVRFTFLRNVPSSDCLLVFLLCDWQRNVWLSQGDGIFRFIRPCMWVRCQRKECSGTSQNKG